MLPPYLMSVDFDAETKLAHEMAESRHWEAMEQSLAALTVPTARTAPSSLRMNRVSRNPRFCGREAVATDMCNRLVADNQKQLRSYLIHGIGGVGKTQLALLQPRRCHFDPAADRPRGRLAYTLECDSTSRVP